MYKFQNILAALMAGILFLGNAAMAQEQEQLPAYPDESHITITGTVASTNDNQFTLDYGTDQVTVEMDDWEWFDDAAQALNPGETVTVTGLVDDQFFGDREIEADTVYVHDRFAYYYREGEDNRDNPYFMGDPLATAREGSWVSAVGTVTGVQDRQFIVDIGGGALLNVDTAALRNNPLDDFGFQQIDIGDRVYVSGRLDNQLFNEREIEAASIIMLTQDPVMTSRIQ